MAQELDDYEADEEFTLEFVSIDEAIKVNETADHFEKEEFSTFRGMIDRENKVLMILKDEI